MGVAGVRLDLIRKGSIEVNPLAPERLAAIAAARQRTADRDARLLRLQAKARDEGLVCPRCRRRSRDHALREQHLEPACLWLVCPCGHAFDFDLDDCRP